MGGKKIKWKRCTREGGKITDEGTDGCASPEKGGGNVTNEVGLLIRFSSTSLE